MRPGDMVLIRLPAAGGATPKLRPALILSMLPGPYQNTLICGVSTQLHELQADWDDMIGPSDSDFAGSGLRRASVIRLSYLFAADANEIVGVIGAIANDRLRRLLLRLANQLTQ